VVKADPLKPTHSKRKHTSLVKQWDVGESNGFSLGSIISADL